MTENEEKQNCFHFDRFWRKCLRDRQFWPRNSGIYNKNCILDFHRIYSKDAVALDLAHVYIHMYSTRETANTHTHVHRSVCITIFWTCITNSVCVCVYFYFYICVHLVLVVELSLSLSQWMNMRQRLWVKNRLCIITYM